MKPDARHLALLHAAECWSDPARRAQYFQLYTSASVWHGLPPELPPTLDGARQFYAQVWAATPTVVLQIDEVQFRGDRLGCHYSVFTQPQRLGPGRHGLTVLRFEANQCAERWTRLNKASFEQLLAQSTT